MKEVQGCDNETLNLAKLEKKNQSDVLCTHNNITRANMLEVKMNAPPAPIPTPAPSSCDLASLVRTPGLPRKTKLLARAKIFIVAIMYKPRKEYQCSGENSSPVVFLSS